MIGMNKEKILNKADMNSAAKTLSPAPFVCKITIDGETSEGDAYALTVEEAKEKIIQAYGHLFDDIVIECSPK